MYNSADVSAAICAPETKDHSVISKNVATEGGGVYNIDYSAPRFTNMEIRENIARNNGGGVFTVDVTRPVFTNVTIARNSSSYRGGGVATSSYYLTMTNVTISGNKAATYGGGIYNVYGGAVLTNVLVEGNSANRGGGILNSLEDPGSRQTVLIMTNGIVRNNTGGGIDNNYAFTGDTTASMSMHVALTNVLIAGNTQSNGGGIFNYNNAGASISQPGKGISILLNNVTIANNTATSGNGGGIYIPTANSGGTNKVSVTANNTIIWGNTASTPAYHNILNVTQSRLTLNYSLAQDGSYTGSNNKDPAKFIGTYGPFTGAAGYAIVNGTNAGSDATARLVNGGSNTLYPNTATGVDTLLGGALTGTGTQETDFKALIQAAVFDSGAITKDAPQATGASTASHGVRFTGTIDVGAYEN
jgi:hypothetical protein